MSKKKSSDMKKDEIDKLSNDKPVVYKIKNKKGDNIYTGIAKRGRVKERIKEHLPKGTHPIPGGSKVSIDQKSSIDDVRKAEGRIIKRSMPKHNKQGK